MTSNPLAHKPDNRASKKPGGSRYAALAFLAILMLAIGAYVLNRPVDQAVPPHPPAVQKVPGPPHSSKPQPPTALNYSAAGTLKPAPQRYPDSAPVEEDTPSGARPAGQAGRLAIIVDDMGGSMQEARSLAGINVPLTFSIIPGLHRCREVAAFAASNGIETMIHVPMQPKGWPEQRLEAHGLLVSMADEVLRERLEDFTRTIPQAVGANNHMGSEFTEHEEKMRVVLSELKGRGLFFIDSVTSSQSVGNRLARELEMKYGRRNVFLDNEQNHAYIQGQLDQAVRLAKKRGWAIAICHPHPATIRTLQSALPRLAGQGVILVPASQLVR